MAQLPHKDNFSPCVKKPVFTQHSEEDHLVLARQGLETEVYGQ